MSNQETQVNQNPSRSGFWTLSKIILSSVGGLFILLVVSALFFLWDRDIHWHEHGYVIDHELLGTFGDFCGGIIGLFLSLFACVLMIWTFREQRKLTEKTIDDEIQRADANSLLQTRLSDNSSKQVELQRFNDLFFQLLALYRQQDNELRTANGGSPYFFHYMGVLRHDFKEYAKFGDSNRYAAGKYLDFYLRHAWEIAPHFRTLYRIFNLIDSSEIDDNNKLEFAKIVRAQLSEGEIFFLRYNCMTPYGKKFKEYVNKYRLLKHLPFLSLLEAKRFCNLLVAHDDKSALDLNVVAYDVCKAIYDRVVGNIPLTPSEKANLIDTPKYKMFLIMRSDSSLILELQRNNKVKRVPKMLRYFDSLNDDKMLELIYTMLRELFEFSNFREYNPNITISKKMRTKKDITSFLISVKNDTRLRLSHPAWDIRYGIV